MNLRGSRGAGLRGEDELRGKSNYLLGNDPRQWRRNVPTFSRLRYSGVYPGVDLLFYGNSGELEHDFIVQPGADPGRIDLEFKGAQRMHLDPSGDLRVETESGILILKRPVSYQKIEGRRREVSASFILDQQQVRFRIGNYDRRHTLTIDPVMIFGTYLGGNGSDQINTMTLDSAGNIYLTGETSSTNFPTKTPEQPACTLPANSICDDAFITKLDPTGSTLIYSTYLGGRNSDSGESIAVAPNGVVTVAGVTDSPDFPTVNDAVNFPPTLLQVSGWFVTSLSADGTTLVHSGILEAQNGSGSVVVTVDAAGNAYVAAQTVLSQPHCLPTIIAGSFLGLQPLFVVKLDPTGLVAYCAIIAGTSPPIPNQPQPVSANNFVPAGIAVDSTGAAYITGTSASGDLPVTPGVIGSSFTNAAAFALKIDPTGSSLVYATNIPGTASASGLLPTGGGNVLLVGNAAAGLPVSPNAFLRSANGKAGYILELGPAAATAPFATYFTGDGMSTMIGIEASTSINAIAVGPNGNLYITGETSDFTFPLVTPLQTFLPGTAGFISELNSDGSALLFSTMLNGTEPANFHAIAVDSAGTVVVAGDTGAHDFPTTSGSFQPQLPLSTDHGVIAKIDPVTPAGEVCAFPFGLGFPTVLVNTSTQLPMTFYNCGNATLHITGVASSNPSFSVTANCASVPPNTTCPAVITYSPTAVGSDEADISFHDDAGLPGLSNFAVAGMSGNASANPPPTVLINGTPVVTVKSGSPAVFNFSATPLFGFTGPVTVSCTLASPTRPTVPQFATCTPSPSSVTLAGSPVNFTVTVSTQTVSRNVWSSSNGIFFALIFAGPLGLVIAGKRRRNRVFLAVGALSMLVLLLSCGGGGSPPPIQQPPPPPQIHNTPAGIYEMDVATSLANQTTFRATLVVQ